MGFLGIEPWAEVRSLTVMLGCYLNFEDPGTRVRLTSNKAQAWLSLSPNSKQLKSLAILISRLEARLDPKHK